MIRRLCAAVAAAQLLSSGWAAADEATVRLPLEERVVFQGVLSLDHAGSSIGPMLYAVPAGGLPIAVVAHAAMIRSDRDRQIAVLRKSADKVLEPLMPMLQQFKHADLLQRALPKMTRAIPPGAFLGSTPVFLMTQDQSAIIVENVIALYPAPGSSKPQYRNTIRAVSRAQDAEDLTAMWAGNGGEKL